MCLPGRTHRSPYGGFLVGQASCLSIEDGQDAHPRTRGRPSLQRLLRFARNDSFYSARLNASPFQFFSRSGLFRLALFENYDQNNGLSRTSLLIGSSPKG